MNYSIISRKAAKTLRIVGTIEFPWRSLHLYVKNYF